VSESWRSAAACLNEDPDLFQPDNPTSQAIEEAKSVCRRCPSVDACLRYALAHNIQEGILGGLTAGERQSLRRAAARHRLTADAVIARAGQAREPRSPRPTTIRDHIARHTVRIFGGHLEWVGPKRPWIAGKSYTPAQLVFVADRGREPKGRVMAGCIHVGCIKPSHLTDGLERAVPVPSASAA
jgi:WhiB family redox-sensing transcriptional regulator